MGSIPPSSILPVKYFVCTNTTTLTLTLTLTLSPSHSHLHTQLTNNIHPAINYFQFVKLSDMVADSIWPADKHSAAKKLDKDLAAEIKTYSKPKPGT